MTSVQRGLAIFGMAVREAYVQHGIWIQSDPRQQLWYKCVTCMDVVSDTCSTGIPPLRPPELPF